MIGSKNRWVNFETLQTIKLYHFLKNKLIQNFTLKLMNHDVPWYKQCGVTPHFSTGQNLLKKILRKDKYWHNKSRKAFSTGKKLLKKY